MKSLISFLIVLGLAPFAGATGSDDVKRDAKKAASTAVDYTAEQKAKVQKDMEDSLQAMNKKIAELRVDADKKGDSLKAGAKEKIAELEKKQAELEAELAKMKASSGRAWNEMKKGMSAALKSLSDSYKKAKDQFN